MSAYRFHSSRPTDSVVPRAHRDASQRFQTYGKVQPMDEDRPSLLARLFGRRR